MSVVILEGQSMRVTAETKAVTRQRILEAARQLFATSGYEASTTRDIAVAAGIANGTLFNYFATKEAILASLAAEAVAAVHFDLEDNTPNGQSLEEDLFALVAAGLRKLKTLRKHLPALLETELNPLVAAPADEARALRLTHLETVSRLAKKHGQGDLSPMALQLYWTLYIGVLMYWAQDRSPKQENTLALLDESLAMFAGWLQREDNSEMKGGAEPCPRP
jgi:AcrR family transcriptional regulator